MTTRIRQKGMTVIELIVAMGLGVFLITGVINVFLSNKASSQIETSLARLQENGRIAMDMLVSDLRDAYYIGCLSRSRFVDEMATGVDWEGMLGWERLTGGWSPALPGGLNGAIGGEARVGSDVLYVAHGRRLVAQTTATVNSLSNSIPLSSNLECISDGETVIIATCSHASLFEVTNTPACDGSATTFEFDATGNSKTNLDTDYPAGTELFQTFDKVWYVRDTDRTRTANDIPVFALYRRANGQEEEMVEGVEYLQVLYGQRLPNSNNTRYVPASDANLDLADDNIVSVRVAVLMQSFEPVLDANDANTYQVLDESIGDDTTYAHNGDRTLRRVFQTTVLMKNPGI